MDLGRAQRMTGRNMIREEERPATRSSHSAPDGVVLVDAERRLLWWSAGMEAALEKAGRRLSVTVAGRSRNGDWMQQRPGQVFRYLLASRGGAQRSEAIANALWPERGPSAVANVRYCIFKLREHLADRGDAGSSLIARDAAGYRIDIARVELDVDEFQAK